MKAWIALASISLGASAAAAGVFGSQYQSAGQCGPFPSVTVDAAQGFCVGIVAGPDQGLKMPRLIVEWRPGDFILTDMGGWVGANGRVMRLSVGNGGQVVVTTLFAKRRQPHGLAVGPEGKIYVGEKGRIGRFDPAAPNSAMETVVEGLPEDGLHLLTNLVFLKDGALVVNIGAPTDRCETKERPLVPQNPCPLTTGDRPRAALWKLTFDKPGGKVVKTEVLARGLRNSMALAVDPRTGVLFQGENGVDLPGEDEPVEELNIITAGKHFGWPSCSGNATPVPGTGLTKADCAKFQSPAIELPAHAAPLGMVVYDGAMFPSLSGKILIALHGYRKYGHRIVAVEPKSFGAARPEMEDIVAGWSRKRGVRPLGAPVGLTQSRDGALWFVEDKNRTVMVLLKSGAARDAKPAAQTAAASPAIPQPKGWEAFARDVLTVKCAACHVETRAPDPAAVWAKAVESDWVGGGPLKDSKLARALLGVGPEKPMPPPAGLKADPKAKAAFDALLKANP